MVKRLFLILAISIIFFQWNCNAQLSEIAVPYSITANLAPLRKFEKLPPIPQELKKEYSSRLKSKRFAHMFQVSFHPFNSGEWEETGEGKVWRLGISSQDAFSLYLVFGEFMLEPGVKLFVYNSDFTGLAGAFTEKNNNERNILTIAPIPGDKIIIELNIPWGVENFGRLLVSKVGHDYRNEFGKDKLKLKAADSGKCNVDINCPEGQDWQYEKRAVCRLVADGELCTGTLINNAENQRLPYLITAYHCIPTEAVAEESVFVFNYENITCGEKTPTTPQSLSGAQLLATTEHKLDFSLLKLWEYPPLYYRPFFVGWDARPDQPSAAICIHHPNGDVKKISIENHPLYTGSYDQKNDPLPHFDSLSHWVVSHWEVGTTEGGSSGSSIFNRQHRIVGTLTGGAATCESPVYDYFTKFTLAWNKYPLPGNRLDYWLDPQNKGVNFMNGIDPYNIQLGVCDTFWNIPKNEHITLLNNGLKWGWISGHNSGKFTRFAEKFSSRSLIQIPGVFLYVAKSRPANPFSFITVKLWEGTSFPETEIYNHKVYLRTLQEGKVNFAGFDTLLTVAGTFFAGYEINYDIPSDTFAVYHAANRGVSGPSTMYVYDGEWKNIDAAYSPAIYTSLSIGLVGCGGSIIVPEAKGVQVNPNPCITEALVDLPEGITVTYIQCFDALGRSVPLPYELVGGKLIIYPVKLSNGVYLLKVGTTSVPLIGKFQVWKD